MPCVAMLGTPVQWATLFCTLVFGLAATRIAYQQWRTNLDKTRIDMFQQRYDVYEKTIEFLQASGTGQLTGEIRDSFLAAVVKSQFLFDRDLYGFLDELHRDGMSVAPRLDNTAQIVSKHWELLGTVTDQWFAKYLDLKHLGR
jgi:hypothetical protein